MLSLYERNARLTPGLLGIAPVSVTVTALGFKQVPVVALLIGLLVTAGGAYAFSLIVAWLGRAAQRRLWVRWGGQATLQLLRTRRDGTNPTQREIWRSAIMKYTSVTLLSEAEEKDHPDRADDAINAAVGQCLPLGHGGDQGRTVVAAENAQYGYERNVYGFRWFGRGIAGLCLAGLVVAPLTSLQTSTTAVIAGLIVNAGLLVFWLLAPSAARAKAANERYATQLLNAVASETRST